MSMLYRWIISSCIERGREPPGFVRRRLERDALLRSHARRLAALDDRLREERPELPAERRVVFNGVPFSRSEEDVQHAPVGRITPMWQGAAALAALILIGVFVAIAFRSSPQPGPEPSDFQLASEIRDLRADASLLSRRILEHLPRRPRVGQQLDGDGPGAAGTHDAG